MTVNIKMTHPVTNINRRPLQFGKTLQPISCCSFPLEFDVFFMFTSNKYIGTT